MAVQQAIATPGEIGVELLRIRRDRRRALVNEVVLELAGGIRSVNELDVLRGCRERGIPEPDRQSRSPTSAGSYYLDFRWSQWRVALEVDGIQHAWAEQLVGDALRHNSIALTGDVVLRLPVLGLRTCPDDFFDQVIEALESAGCQDVMRRGSLPAARSYDVPPPAQIPATVTGYAAERGVAGHVEAVGVGEVVDRDAGDRRRVRHPGAADLVAVAVGEGDHAGHHVVGR